MNITDGKLRTKPYCRIHRIKKNEDARGFLYVVAASFAIRRFDVIKHSIDASRVHGQLAWVRLNRMQLYQESQTCCDEKTLG